MMNLSAPLLILCASALIFSASLISFSQSAPGKQFPGITISNFGQMDERYYRGARPKEGKGQFEALKSLGVQTVIDLQDNPREYEKREAEAAGLRYINIPMADGEYPDPTHIAEFLRLANDPETGVFFAHCAGGRHRTGITGAAYRMTKYGWDLEKSYKEMKNFDFYSRWGHGEQKDFVKDFAAKIERERAATIPTVTAAVDQD
jgi:protein-tyrosine phosphatase